MLAHNCAVVGLNVDVAMIYDPPDQHFLDWLEIVCDQVRATRERQNRDANRGSGG